MNESFGFSYLLAKCYSDVGLLSEAEDTIMELNLPSKSIDDIAEAYQDLALYVLLLLGDLHRQQGRFCDASACYRKCLELNPMMWTAFKNLCNIGQAPDPVAVFRSTENLILTTPTHRLPQPTTDKAKSIPDDIKAEPLDIMCSENVNPENDTELVAHSSHPTNVKQQDRVFPSVVSHTSVQRSYLTHCSTDYLSSLVHHEDVVVGADAFQTPQSTTIPVAYALKAPKLGAHPFRRHESSKVTFSGLGDSRLDAPTPVSPKFGSLALLSQSPMFASVPVSAPISSHSSVIAMPLFCFFAPRCVVLW